MATMLADFQGRIVSIYALGRPGDASDIHNHGTHVTGSVLGDGANSNGRIRGMAPAARVVFQSTMDASRKLGGLPTDLCVGLFDVARDDGARIHTNSWSSVESDGTYLANANQADTFAFNNREFLILFSASNDAPFRVASSGTAKNVLTVGASESERPLPNTVNFPGSPMFPGGATWPNFDRQADDKDDVADFSSPGPTQSNRRKPDVVAPGTFILSTRSSVSVEDTGPDGLIGKGGTGDEDGIFTHAEAVGQGLPGQPLFGAADQNAPDAPAGSGPDVTQNYYYSNGTSMSTPITAGACALVRQYLIQQRNHIPSAALLKAIIINGAIDMGMGIPDNGQGWGRIELNNSLFPIVTRRVQFDDNLDNAVTTGDIRTYEVFVSSTDEPLAVTLVWRDPAGNTIQNRLHLRVIPVDSGTTFTADDITNILNNVQKVVIDPPQVGLYRIEVEGVNIGTGVPELTGLHQDYALVVANAMGFSCNPSDIVQVIDRSGSMGFSGYMTPAKERAKQMVDILQINDKAGIVSFHASADEILPLTQINSQGDKDNAHTIIDTVTSAGMTDLREALEQGMTTLGLDTGRPRAIVFLSDGKHTVLTPAIDNPFIDSIAAGNVKVYTIALGPASDIPVLDTIANRTGTGSAYTVESAADLHKLHEIYYNILGDIGCGGVIHLSSDSVDLGNGLKQAVAVDASVREANFAVSWELAGAYLDFSLEDPSGKVYDPDSKGAFHYSGSTHQFYRVANPKAGIWQMILKVKEASNNQPLYVTTAALTDSDVTCDVQIDPKYLYHGKLMLMLRVAHGDRPLVGGKAKARITYPTQTIQTVLKKYARELKEIKVDKEKLAGDEADENLIKLGILAAQYGENGKDLFERKTRDIKLSDDGREGDPRSNDGIYTAYTSISDTEIAGPFQIQTLFDVDDEKLGTYSCTKLIPEYIPSIEEPRLIIQDIFCKSNDRWRFVIIGATVSWDDGTAAKPEDGVDVSMTLIQGDKKLKYSKLPYYGRDDYYIWRLWTFGFKSGKAEVKVEAKLNGTVVAKESEVIKI
ncbi:Serine protease [Candidatus Methanophagaceae archaeon]|nr:Serine protease [Methanophagales archaeon]